MRFTRIGSPLEDLRDTLHTSNRDGILHRMTELPESQSSRPDIYQCLHKHCGTSQEHKTV